MEIKELLPLWLERGERDRRKLAREAQQSYELLPIKTTPFARACRRIAEVHDAAADVYATALKTEHLLEHDPRGQIGQ